MRAFGPLVSTLAVGALMVAGGPRLRPAQAQDDGAFDHLQCFSIREQARSDDERVDVAPRDGIFLDDDGNPVDLLDAGCKVELPAREICVAADAVPRDDEGEPRPAGPEAGDFLCYEVRCGESNARERLDVDDQFGSHRVDVLDRPTRLCVPATRATGVPTPAPSASPGMTATPAPSGSPASTPTPGGSPGTTPTARPIQTPTPNAGAPSPGITATPRPIVTPPPDGPPVPTLPPASRAAAGRAPVARLASF